MRGVWGAYPGVDKFFEKLSAARQIHPLITQIHTDGSEYNCRTLPTCYLQVACFFVYSNMGKEKESFQSLPLLEQVALSVWLSQLIRQQAEAQVAAGTWVLERNGMSGPSEWMREEAEKALLDFEAGEETGFSWEEVKRMGDQRKTA